MTGKGMLVWADATKRPGSHGVITRPALLYQFYRHSVTSAGTSDLPQSVGLPWLQSKGPQLSSQRTRGLRRATTVETSHREGV